MVSMALCIYKFFTDIWRNQYWSTAFKWVTVECYRVIGVLKVDQVRCDLNSIAVFVLCSNTGRRHGLTKIEVRLKCGEFCDLKLGVP